MASAAAGAALHLGFLFQVFTPKSPAGLLFPLVVLAPWLLLVTANHLAAHRTAARRVSFIASVAYLAFGAWAFWDTIYVHPDPQGGLVFVVIPVAASMVFGVLNLILLATRPRSTPEQAPLR